MPSGFSLDASGATIVIGLASGSNPPGSAAPSPPSVIRTKPGFGVITAEVSGLALVGPAPSESLARIPPAGTVPSTVSPGASGSTVHVRLAVASAPCQSKPRTVTVCEPGASPW